MANNSRNDGPESDPEAEAEEKDLKNVNKFLPTRVVSIFILGFVGGGFGIYGSGLLNGQLFYQGWGFISLASSCGCWAARLWVINHRTKHRMPNWLDSHLTWILINLLCVLACFGAAFYSSRIIQTPIQAPQSAQGQWQPPELPIGCKDVVIWFGGQGTIYPLQALTNYPWGPVMTSVPITKLPPNARTNLPNLPGFSPRLKEVLGVFSVKHVINGKNEDFYPVIPQVISNRLYVFVKIPFTNYQRIVMSDQMDPILTNCLPQSPAFWDWNYSNNTKTNAFEIVNENKNPIVQVIYKTPREVLVNGVFFVSHYDIQATFDGKYPGCFSIPNATTNAPADLFGVVLTNQFGGIFPTNQPKAGKHQLPIYQVGFGATNLIYFAVVEDVYSGFATNQKSIFKYPSNLFPGEFAE